MNVESPSDRFVRHTNCEDCGSSDARALYNNQTSWCFSCESWGTWDGDEPEERMPFESLDDLNNIASYDIRGFAERKIPKAISEFFDVRVEYNEAREIVAHYYPYTQDGSTVAYKRRNCVEKDFSIVGKFNGVQLFGQDKFSAGGKMLVITEGEIDAMSVATAFQKNDGKIWPVVSLPSASGHKAVLNNLEWVRSFEKVILMLDQDEAGQKAVQKVAKTIGVDKAHIATLPEKDANDVLIKDDYKTIIRAMWDAQPYSPAGIITSDKTWDMYKAEKDAVYTPWPPFVPKLNQMTFGRRLGSITMITSGTGSGKSTFLKEDMVHLLRSTDEMIGICSLEESVAETVRGFLSIELNKRVGLPNVDVSEEEERKAWEATMGTGRCMIIDHQGSVSDNSLIEKLEFLAKSGCRYIFLDHITIAVSEVDGGSNSAIDSFMSDLLKIAKRHHVWFGVVSHLRKTQVSQTSFESGGDISEDDLRGSGSLKQISAQIFALMRNKHAEDSEERHTVKVKLLKDRWTGESGYASGYRFDHETGRLHAVQSTTVQGLEKLDE